MMLKINMKQDDCAAPRDHKHRDKDQSQQQQGGTLWLTAAIVGMFLIGTAIFAVVEVCRAWLDVPKDTEVGVMAVVAVVTLFAIVGQIIVTALQWKVAGDQWQVMRDGLNKTQRLLEQNEISQTAFINTERAYIGIRSIKLVEPLRVDKMPAVQVIFVNGGRTPAWNLIGNCMPISDNTKSPLAILDEYIEEFARELSTTGMEGTDLFGQTGLLPAGAEDDNPPIHFVGDIKEWGDGLGKIIAERIPLYVVGWARYRDFQGNRYRYEFISYYNKAVDGFIECVSRTIDDPEPKQK